MTCPLCYAAEARGWWGPGHRGTHCCRCHRSWTSRKEAHCPTCCAHFSTPANFDRHLAPRGCRPPGEVRDRAGEVVLVADDRGVWRSAVSRTDLERLSAIRGGAS